MSWKIRSRRRPENTKTAGEFYAQDAGRYSKSGAMKRIQRGLTMRALELAMIPLGAKVLDVGCGTGYSMEVLREVGYKDTAGVDVSRAMLAEAKKKKFKVKLGSATDLPFPPHSFDAIISISTLQWLSAGEAEKAAEEFHRVLSGGGKAAIQFYPESGEEAIRFGKAFKDAGFKTTLTTDNPSNPRKRKVFLVLEKQAQKKV